MWFLEAEGVDVVRSDGAPFRQHDLVKLQSTKGARLGANQSPDKIATLFRDQGVSASYTRVGQADSAVGRIFDFCTAEIKLGGGMKKPVRLFPRALLAEDFVLEGDPRVIDVSSRDEDAATANPAASAPSEADSVAIVKEVLSGVTPAGMFDAIMADGRCSSIATVYGVPLLESATDESLANVLVENKAMALLADGTLAAL